MTPDRILAHPDDEHGWLHAHCSSVTVSCDDAEEFVRATPHHAAQLLLSHIENNNDKRQSIDPSGHCVKLIHGLRAIAEEGK